MKRATGVFLALLMLLPMVGCQQVNNFWDNIITGAAFSKSPITANVTVTPPPPGTVGWARGHRLGLRWDPPGLARAARWDHAAAIRALGQLPPSADLRTSGRMPAIYDQGNLGSCTANSAAADLAFLDATLPNPARLYIYEKTLIAQGTPNQDAGASIGGTVQELADSGGCQESLWPYSEDLSGTPTAAADADAANHRVLARSSVAQDEQAIEAALASGLPIQIGIQVYDSFESDAVASSGTVPMPDAANEQLLGGHAVLIVGYDDARRLFVVRNSWGIGWGDHGYFTLPYGYVLSADLASDFWLCRSAGKPAAASARPAESSRSPEWRRVREAHLKSEPVCQWCGGSECLQVHHILPFHLFPQLELQDSNLITLCEKPGFDCHFLHGHNGDWKSYNPSVRADCATHRQAATQPAGRKAA